MSEPHDADSVLESDEEVLVGVPVANPVVNRDSTTRRVPAALAMLVSFILCGAGLAMLTWGFGGGHNWRPMFGTLGASAAGFASFKMWQPHRLRPLGEFAAILSAFAGWITLALSACCLVYGIAANYDDHRTQQGPTSSCPQDAEDAWTAKQQAVAVSGGSVSYSNQEHQDFVTRFCLGR